MNDEQIVAAVWDLISDDREKISSSFKVLKEAGGSAAAVLLRVAHEWSEDDKTKWLSLYRSGSPPDILEYIICDSQAVEALAKALHDPDPRFRGFAAYTLAETEDPRVPDLLVQAFSDEDPNVRCNAVYGFGHLADDRSYELIKKAMKDPHEKVRSTAAWTLRWAGEEDCIDILIQALDDPSERVARSAAGSLGFLYVESAFDPLIKVLQDERSHLASAAARALGDIDNSRAVAPLINIIKTSTNYLVQLTSAEVLVKLAPDQAVEPVLELIHNLNYPYRALATQVLGTLRCDRVHNALVEFLADNNPWVAHAAAFALASMGDQRAVDPLLALLKIEPKIVPVKIGFNPDVYRDEDANSSIRNYAALVIGDLGDTRAIEPLVNILENQTHAIAAAKSLVQLGDNRGFEYLIDMLKSEDKQYISKTIEALGKLNDPRAVIPLKELLDSVTTSQSIKSFIIKTLAQIGTKEALDTIRCVMQSDSENAIDAAAELAKLGYDAGFDYLSFILKDGDEGKRERAVIKLNFISDPHAIELLLFALQDKSDKVRLHVIHSLDRIGNKRLINHLEAMLSDKSRLIRSAAATTIRKLTKSPDN